MTEFDVWRRRYSKRLNRELEALKPVNAGNEPVIKYGIDSATITLEHATILLKTTWPFTAPEVRCSSSPRILPKPPNYSPAVNIFTCITMMLEKAPGYKDLQSICASERSQCEEKGVPSDCKLNSKSSTLVKYARKTSQMRAELVNPNNINIAILCHQSSGLNYKDGKLPWFEEVLQKCIINMGWGDKNIQMYSVDVLDNWESGEHHIKMDAFSPQFQNQYDGKFDMITAVDCGGEWFNMNNHDDVNSIVMVIRRFADMVRPGGCVMVSKYSNSPFWGLKTSLPKLHEMVQSDIYRADPSKMMEETDYMIVTKNVIKSIQNTAKLLGHRSTRDPVSRSMYENLLGSVQESKTEAEYLARDTIAEIQELMAIVDADIRHIQETDNGWDQIGELIQQKEDLLARHDSLQADMMKRLTTKISLH